MKVIGIGYLVIVLAMSLITFVMYGWDKRQARCDQRRIPESRLHWLALLGGWPGALVGRGYFRHKTQKTMFTIKTWCIVTIHLALILGVAYWLFSNRGV